MPVARRPPVAETFPFSQRREIPFNRGWMELTRIEKSNKVERPAGQAS
jgi:hypothetical protein